MHNHECNHCQICMHASFCLIYTLSENTHNQLVDLNYGSKSSNKWMYMSKEWWFACWKFKICIESIYRRGIKLRRYRQNWVNQLDGLSVFLVFVVENILWKIHNFTECWKNWFFHSSHTHFLIHKSIAFVCIMGK